MPRIIAKERMVSLELTSPLSPFLTDCMDGSGQACLLVRPQGNLLLSMPHHLYSDLEKRVRGVVPSHYESMGFTSPFLTKSVELGKAFLDGQVHISDFIENRSFFPGNESLHVKMKDSSPIPIKGEIEKVGMSNFALGFFFPSPYREKTDFLYSFFPESEINAHLRQIDDFFNSGETFGQFVQVLSSLGEPLSVFTSFPLYQSLVETLRLYKNPEYGAELLRRHNNLDDEDFVPFD